MEIQTGKLQKAYRVVIYGQEGVGKSTLASRFPAPLFLDIEGSTDRMDVHRLPTPQSWSELLQTIGKITESPPDGYKTLVIDTLDWSQRLCSDHVIASKPTKDGETRDSIEAFGFGRGYTFMAEEFGHLLDALSELRDRQNWNIVLLCHAAIRKFELPEEDRGYDRWEMKLERRPQSGTSCFTITKEWSELLLFASYKTMVVKDNETGKLKATGEKRVMRTTHTATWDGKNRDGLDEELPLTFESIAHLFRTEKKVATKPKPVPEQQPVSPPSDAPDKETSAPVDDAPAPDTDGKVTEKTLGALKALQDGEFPTVTDAELMAAVAKQGYFPADMPLSDLPDEFVSGKLIPAWKRVLKVVKKVRQENQNDD